MKKESKNIKLAALASGAAIIGAFGNTASANELLNFEDLGSASELRSNLITADAMTAFTSNTDVEFECGEGKCGEGKCGEEKSDKAAKTDKKDDKASTKAAMKPAKEEKKEGASMEMAPKSKTEKTEKKATKAADPKN